MNIKELNKKFFKIKNSDLLKKIMFWKINFNRLVQTSYLIINNPNLLKHVVTAIKNVWIKKQTQLRSVELAITYNCNCSCEQCSCRKEFDLEKEKNQRLSLEEYKKIIDQAFQMGAFQFCINGGEPLLYKDIVFALTEYINNKGGYTHLCTNGYLLDEEVIKKLKFCGLNSIEMGFDASEEKEHDKNRRSGSYSKIVEAIKLAKKYKMIVILNTILTNSKFLSEDIYRTIEFAVKNKVFLQVTPCCLTGALKNRLDLLLTEDSKLFFYYILSFSYRMRSDLYSSLTKIKCPAAYEKIGIQPYGDVVSCPLIQIKYGNIRDLSLKEIQEKMFENPNYGKTELFGCLPAMDENFIRSYLIDKK